ncbi:hypothetical protein MTR_5g064010 [Medicago truncatula]|uniref:Uncharacterized protein n=1 Tax=Medicago truncatula TaxID=3880 RepID=G7KB98_MEDTR|nr:hypothetical protein MTR_5g064010 [Medicago truncatula]
MSSLRFFGQCKEIYDIHHKWVKILNFGSRRGIESTKYRIYFTFNTSYVSIIVDRNFRQTFLPYFRKMEDIIEINYGNFKIIIFKCKWVGTERDRGYKKWNLNGINLDRFIHNEGHEEHDCTLRHLKHKWCIMLDR